MFFGTRRRGTKTESIITNQFLSPNEKLATIYQSRENFMIHMNKLENVHQIASEASN